MKVLNEDIKNGNFHHIYLIYGEEGYLCRQFTSRLVQAIAGDDTMNCTWMKGKDIDIKEWISLADTLPFFAEHRLIIVEDSGWFKRDSKEAAAYLDILPETTLLIFKETEVDKRNGLYKKVNKLGYVAQMQRQSEKDLERWILMRLKSENVQIHENTMHYFLASVGNDMNALTNELDKLISYVADRQLIEIADINQICSIQIVGKIFEMIDAISLKKTNQALQMYYDLLVLKEPPMRILFFINKQYLQFYQLKELQSQGLSDKEIGQEAGLNSYVAKKICQKASTFTFDELKLCLKACIDMDYGIKTGEIKDKMAVELLITALSSGIYHVTY